MKVSVVGTGYVGLVTGTGLAEVGNTVLCVDKDNEKIENLKKGIIPIHEPGLKELVDQNIKFGRLSFGSDLSEAIKSTDVIFIAVGTPPLPNGRANLEYVYGVAKEIGKNINSYKVIVIKSTVPVGTGTEVHDIISKAISSRKIDVSFDVVSNPEFLKEGAAIEDFMKPDRIVIGTDSTRAREMMEKVYKSFFRQSERIIFMDRASSELTKYAANAMLATRISFMNELSQLCEKAGANIAAVRNGIGTDHRIGLHFIYPGIGYGGSCFPKDVQALMTTARDQGMTLGILEAVHEANEKQKTWFYEKIKTAFSSNLAGKTFALWGLSFKPGTDDVRESPAIDLAKRLLKMGAKVQAYDPVATQNAKKEFSPNDQIQFMSDSYHALEGADALILATEWREFRAPDFAKIKTLLKSPIFFDGRNQHNASDLISLGFTYHCVGKNHCS